MKALKQIFTGILCCTLTLVLVTNVTAQDRKEGPKDPEVKAKKQTMMMSKKLDLNDEQKSEVHEINMKYAEQSYELKQEMTEEGANEEGENEELKMRHKRMMNEKRSEIQKVLNEEQIERFEEMHKSKHEKKKGLKRDKREMEEKEEEEMEESEDY